MTGYSIGLRLLLILASLLTVLYVLRRIRHAKVQIEDCIFWFLFSGVLLLLSIFPQITFWAADLLGLQAPINVVYLGIIFLLILKQFFMSLRISELDAKLKSLAQKMAISEEKEHRSDHSG